MTFNYYSYGSSPVPPMNVQFAPGALQAAEATVSVKDTQSASTPMAGSFLLGIGEYCDTVQVAVGETAESLQAKITSLPGVTGGVDVTVSGSVHDSLAYTVTFAGLAGDVPSLKITDTTSITGSRPSVTVSTLQIGSSDLFYGPIPADLLRLPVPTNKSIQLEVNGVPSACGTTLEGTAGLVPGSSLAANATSTACSFQASAMATPVLFNSVPNGTIAPLNILVGSQSRGFDFLVYTHGGHVHS